MESESEVAQSCPTLSDPMDCSLPGSSIHRIFPGKSTGVGCHGLLREVSMEVLKKLHLILIYDAVIPLLGKYSKARKSLS